MVISEKSQLGLRFREKDVKVKFLHSMESYLKGEIELRQNYIEKLQKEEITEEEYYLENVNDETYRDVSNKVSNCLPDNKLELLIDDNDNKYFFICESVYKAAELIKINENFTGRTLKDIKFGYYVYLMGKHEMVKFSCVIGAIYGFYYNDKDDTYFEFGIELEEGKYFVKSGYVKQFSAIMQLLTFIELGDIEVQILNARQSNGGKKDVDKIQNSTNNTVYIVDSSWNKLLIRTDGFAVRGHFRLQPCGDGMKDRKLIWINAFEKNGYVRKPKGEIIR